MEPSKRRMTLMRVMAWSCAVLVLAVASLSAFIRQTNAGLGCEPWPECHAQARLEAPSRTDPALASARVAHRIAASVALVLVIAMLVIAVAREPVLWQPARLVAALLAVTLFLAVLGRFGADSRHPLVTVGNLLGGFAMFALSVAVARASGPPRQRLPARLLPWARTGIVLLVIQVAMGAWLSASGVGAECLQLVGCTGLGALHRASAIATAAVLLPLGILAWLGGRTTGLLVALLVLLQLAGAVALVLHGLWLPLALAHNLGAALLVAAVVDLGRRP